MIYKVRVEGEATLSMEYTVESDSEDSAYKVAADLFYCEFEAQEGVISVDIWSMSYEEVEEPAVYNADFDNAVGDYTK